MVNTQQARWAWQRPRPTPFRPRTVRPLSLPAAGLRDEREAKVRKAKAASRSRPSAGAESYS
eukprot:scaffold25615_cov60-Phaeocystis_antarctica.AAC.1